MMPTGSGALRPPTHSMLSLNEREALFQHLKNSVEEFSTKSIGSLLSNLERILTEESFIEVEQLIRGTITSSEEAISPSAKSLTQDMLTRDDLGFLCGYFSFIDNLGIEASETPLEIRIEKRSGMFATGYLALILVPARTSLLRNIPITSLLWTQSEDLVNERFYNRPHGPYLCGAHLGRSKFFSLAPSLLSSGTKAEAIANLGLQGYAKIQELANR